MWVARKRNWNTHHTALSKYLIEKISQSVDYGEIISNQHRTTSGFTLVAEISEVCRQTLLRTKSSRRLQSLLEEAKDKKIKSSIPNDYILDTYFKDLVEYYTGLNPSEIKSNDNLIKRIKLESNIHFDRLNAYYFQYLSSELAAIDLKSKRFDIVSAQIDSLVDCLIPYLLFKGYSSDSIGALVTSAVKARPDYLLNTLLTGFNNKDRTFEFLILDTAEDSKHNEFEKYLKENSYNYEKSSSISQFNLPSSSISNCNIAYFITHETNDPNTFLRTLYEKSFKFYIGHRERVSLPFFSDYFKTAFWRFSNGKKKAFRSTNSKKDPLNVESRNSTLRDTLNHYAACGEIAYSDTSGLPLIKAIKEPVFYYNLALGSKSIENSLMLLWTALETLIPYRFHENDIDNVQYFVSTSLGFGTIGRQISSFACRCIETSKVNDNHLSKHISPLPSCICHASSITEWFNWLRHDFTGEIDPFDDIAECSSLLSRGFTKFNSIYLSGGNKEKKAKHWHEMIEQSENSIKYQLDRIYLHRNQIVHAGKFVNEYTNLWSHLEWYIGKLLAYSYLKCLRDNSFTELDKVQIFTELEADSKHIKNILWTKRDRPISEIADEFPAIFKHTWQFM